ncbi:endonuclease V [Geoglobus acetivorans]|uniref:Endonuclease V n=1 Tax=Geoglobus acetivorans TaxID=565033 RepID=A0A0A7GE32_GEOAI|nr:Endonuclease V [Geoglobus acetivorans]
MNLKRLREIQNEISNRVTISEVEEIEYVAGVDTAFFRHSGTEYAVSSAVLMSYPELELMIAESVVDTVDFPYIPTYLMFRESRTAIKALKKVLREKTVVMVDGSGLAHPRRCGIATYIGVELSLPAIGITKKRLCGEIAGEGDVKKLIVDGEHVGYEILTCRRCKPIYVSVGNRITPEKALEVVMNCLRGYKLPEPVRIADKYSKKVKSQYLSDLDSTF